jgi:hypothetical protein
MAEKFFRIKRIAPCEKRELSGNSWSEKAKIYGIEVGDGDLPCVHRYQSFSEKSTLESVKKWMKKCKWKPPLAMLVISVVQVRIQPVFCLLVFITSRGKITRNARDMSFESDDSHLESRFVPLEEEKTRENNFNFPASTRNKDE